MQPIVRRVVTGQTAAGESVFTHVEKVEPIVRGNKLEWFGVWGWDELPMLPHHSTEPYVPSSVFPAADRKAVRINTVIFPPGHGMKTGAAATAPVVEDAAYAKLMAAQIPGRPITQAMHTTDSVDLGFVLTGEMCLIQGDGSEVTLRPGDVLVQNGAEHAWQNRTDQPSMMCFVVLGAPRR